MYYYVEDAAPPDSKPDSEPAKWTRGNVGSLKDQIARVYACDAISHRTQLKFMQAWQRVTKARRERVDGCDPWDE
jgi:hypothetical protein